MAVAIPETSPQTLARIAGVGYLIIFFTAIYANFFVLESLVVPGDAAATFANLQAGQGEFRLGTVAFLSTVVIDVLLSWAFYLLFRPVSSGLALLTAWFRLVYSAIFGIAIYHLFTVISMLNGVGFAQGMGAGEMALRAGLSLEAFNQVWLIGLVFFGLHLGMLGVMVVKSAAMPRVLGLLLILAGLGYLIDSFANILLPNYADHEELFLMIVAIPGIVGEFSFSVWLLAKGVKEPD